MTHSKFKRGKTMNVLIRLREIRLPLLNANTNLSPHHSKKHIVFSSISVLTMRSTTGPGAFAAN
jgi:hypothetical protein